MHEGFPTRPARREYTRVVAACEQALVKVRSDLPHAPDPLRGEVRNDVKNPEGTRVRNGSTQGLDPAESSMAAARFSNFLPRFTSPWTKASQAPRAVRVASCRAASAGIRSEVAS